MKKQIETDKSHFIEGIRNTNSREQRSRLMIKFNKKLQYYAAGSSTRAGSPINTRFMLSPNAAAAGNSSILPKTDQSLVDVKATK